jgi:hypothetical protein
MVSFEIVHPIYSPVGSTCQVKGLSVEILSINGITRRIGMAYVGPAVNEKLTDAQQLTLEILPIGSETGEPLPTRGKSASCV